MKVCEWRVQKAGWVDFVEACNSRWNGRRQAKNKQHASYALRLWMTRCSSVRANWNINKLHSLRPLASLRVKVKKEERIGLKSNDTQKQHTN